MSEERYICEEHKNFSIFDSECKSYPSMTHICEILNQQSQRIAELEEQLKNAIVPKFKMYDTVYTLNRDRADGIESGKITQINFDGVKIIYQFTIHQTKYCHTYNYKDEKDVFATKEEAQERLQELKGESK